MRQVTPAPAPGRLDRRLRWGREQRASRGSIPALAIAFAAPWAIVAAAVSMTGAPLGRAATGLPPGHSPKAGHYAGPSGEPVTFRVVSGRIRSLRMTTSCGVYTVAATAIHHGDFQAQTGPAGRPLQLYGRFTTSTRAEIEWSVGYTATVMPTCLLHDTWTARRRGP